MSPVKADPTCETHGTPKRQHYKTGARGTRVKDGWRCTQCQTDRHYKWVDGKRTSVYEYNNGYRHRHPEKFALANRRSALKRQFGITIEDYDVMLAAQRGVCAICRKECVTGKRLAVDHDHDTNEVRGLLCGSCNRGLRAFRGRPRSHV